MEFAGQPFSYWIELGQRFEEKSGLEGVELLKEVVELRAKVSFYESRIKQMVKVMG